MSPGRWRCARALSRAQWGLEAPLVQVEAPVGSGLPNFTIVGLAAPVVRESRERVRAAIVSSGFEFPPGRITVNLAPAELSKQGGRFDLPVALAALHAHATGHALIVPAANAAEVRLSGHRPCPAHPICAPPRCCSQALSPRRLLHRRAKTLGHIRTRRRRGRRRWARSWVNGTPNARSPSRPQARTACS